jgi:hypothetical protein
VIHGGDRIHGLSMTSSWADVSVVEAQFQIRPMKSQLARLFHASLRKLIVIIGVKGGLTVPDQK